MRGTNTSQKDTKGTAAKPGQQQTSKQQQQPQQQQQQAKQVPAKQAPAKQIQQQQVKSQQTKVDQPQITKQIRPAAEQQMPIKQAQQKVQQHQVIKETQPFVQQQSLKENQQKAQQQLIRPQQQTKSESIQPLQKRPLGQVQPEGIIIRIYSNSGRSRIEIMNNASFQELQKQVEQRLNVPIKEQIYLLENKNPLKVKDAAQYTLAQLGLKNGDILHLVNENVVVPSSANVNIQKPSGNELIENLAPVQLSSQTSVKEAKQQTEYKQSCSHGPGGKCINCLTKEEKKKEQNEEKNEEKKVESGQKPQKSWLCNHAIGGKCVHCLEDQFISNAKHISFEKFIKDKQAKCQQHPKQSKCPNCLPPSEVFFKVNLSCTKHKPWPLGICNSCMPPAAVLSRQPYRHVDYLQFMNVKEITNFVQYWQKGHQMQQRVGFLYGYYCEDPNYEDGVRAIVESIYEPPQVGDINGFQLLEDPFREQVDRLAASMGFERLGWIFTTINDDAYLTSHEIRLASRFQQEHIADHPIGYKVSKFVTVVIKVQKDGSCLPEAYMISDQIQALERDGVLGDSDRRRRLVVRQPKENEMLPIIMVEGKPTVDFQPEWCIVQIACGLPNSPMSIMKLYDFPVENRNEKQKPSDVKAHINKHGKSGNPKYLADFHLLLYLTQILDIDTTCVIAKSISEEVKIANHLEDLLRQIG